MATFVAFKEESGDVMLLNLDEVRQITKIKKDYCEIHFSESHKLAFRGEAATQTIDIVTQLMAGGPKIDIPE